MHATLPAALPLAATLTQLLGREVKVKANKVATLPSPAKAFVGVYDDGAAQLEVLWLADLPLAASMGACLTLVPAGMVNEAVKLGKLAPELTENAREVANITANSFGEKRVRLVQFLAPAQPADSNVTAFLAAKGAVADFDVSVAGYPGGKLWLVGHAVPPG